MNETQLRRRLRGYSPEYVERMTDDLADYQLQDDRDRMRQYVALYRIESIMSPADAPFGFICHAEDTDHAEEQCVNAYPDCDVVWIEEGEDCLLALENYYHEGMES